MNGVFVTGTDTGAGKSWAACALLHAWRGQGARVAGMKPVASGCEATAEGLRNEDALALQAASSGVWPYATVNPYAFAPPIAPELAAAEAGHEVTMALLQAAHAQLAAGCDVVVVEGAGGWAAPFSPTLDQADVARALGLPVVLVVGLRLGCVSHARLTARAVLDDGLVLAGWIGNVIDPGMLRLDANIDTLRARLPAPCWGVLPHAPGAAAPTAATHLQVPAWDALAARRGTSGRGLVTRGD